MRSAIRKNLANFIAILVLGVIGLAVGGYILDNQRFRFPLIQESPFQIKAELATAQAVTPGQGQTVRVSGVRIGDIAKVELEQGKAVVTLDLDKKYDDLIHTDATALLRPKTGLKDMFLDVNPGSDRAPLAEEGWTMPVANTLPDVNPDEVFSALDADTRDYLKVLIADAGRGLKGRGGDLQDIYKRFEPTYRNLARLNTKVAERRKNLARLTHSLAEINGALAGKDKELAQLIDSSAAVFRAFASEDKNISAAVEELPEALKETTIALRNSGELGEALKPASESLIPAIRSLDKANKTLAPVAKQITPRLREDVRPFIRALRPLAPELTPAAKDLAKSTPSLTRSFVVLNHLFNTISYNPRGAEDPSRRTREEGYLFWIAWLSHQGVQLFSQSDAHGTYRPLSLGATCTTFEQILNEEPQLEFLLGLTPILTNPAICDQDPGTKKKSGAAKAKTGAEAKGGER